MTEDFGPLPFEERLAACPIHKAVNVDEILAELGCPRELYKVVHEIVLTRAQFPPHLTDDQNRAFGRQAVKITSENEIPFVETTIIIPIVIDIVGRWSSSKSSSLDSIFSQKTT